MALGATVDIARRPRASATSVRLPPARPSSHPTAFRRLPSFFVCDPSRRRRHGRRGSDAGDLRAHAFVPNPLRGVSPSAAVESLRSVLDPAAAADPANPHPRLSKILPFLWGRPLALSPDPPAAAAALASSSAAPTWRLAWLPPSRVPGVTPDAFVFLGAHAKGDGKEATAYWAVDVSEVEGPRVDGGGGRGRVGVCGLRTLMVATD